MHVALLANTGWLDEELSLFRQLVVGLIDEQVRVAQVVPEALTLDELSVFGEQVVWTESSLSVINWRRLSRLGGPLGQMGVDLVHALDGALWWPALSLARAMDRPVVLQANAAEDVARAQRLSRWLRGEGVSLAATTEPLAGALREVVGEAVAVELIPQGVHPQSGSGGPVRGADQPMSVVVSGDGRVDDPYLGLLTGMEQVARKAPLTQFFFDGLGSDQHRLWREARRRQLLPNMSFIPRRLGHREMLLRADALVQPQALGRSRSLTLQAMARALPIVAHQDPWLDYLLHDQTAWVVEDGSAETWVTELTRLLDQPEAGHALGRRAEQWVREQRLASQRIAKVLDLYRRLSGAAIPFPG